MNEELQENARESELELREELDLANGRATEVRLSTWQENSGELELDLANWRATEISCAYKQQMLTGECLFIGTWIGKMDVINKGHVKKFRIGLLNRHI